MSRKKRGSHLKRIDPSDQEFMELADLRELRNKIMGAVPIIVH